MKDNFMYVDELIRQDKLGRKTDEALRLLKIYVDNRLVALGAAKRQRTRNFLKRDLQRSVRKIALDIQETDGFLSNRILDLVDSIEMIEFSSGQDLRELRRQHRYVDPQADTRSLAPATPEPSWRDWRY